VSISLVKANSVPPHPVMPLSNMQFTGILLFNSFISEIHFADGAFIFL